MGSLLSGSLQGLQARRRVAGSVTLPQGMLDSEAAGAAGSDNDELAAKGT